jgi:hypothetical protein
MEYRCCHYPPSARLIGLETAAVLSSRRYLSSYLPSLDVWPCLSVQEDHCLLLLVSSFVLSWHPLFFVAIAEAFRPFFEQHHLVGDAKLALHCPSAVREHVCPCFDLYFEARNPAHTHHRHLLSESNYWDLDCCFLYSATATWLTEPWEGCSKDPFQ